MVKVVIGCGKNKNVLLAVKTLEKIENLEIEIANSNNELISAFKDDNVDVVVRGSLKSSNLLKNIKNINNDCDNEYNSHINRMSFINFKNSNNCSDNDLINHNMSSDNKDYCYKSNIAAYDSNYNWFDDNIVDINMNNGFLMDNGFLLGPVGVDEGNTIDEKLELAIQGSEFLLNNGIIPKIAVLAGGRKEDLGRSSDIDESIENSEELVKRIIESFSIEDSKIEINHKNYQKLDLGEFSLDELAISEFSVKNYYILIEKAIMEKNNIIIAPDGIMGNIIFRTLVLLNSWQSNGAIALGSKKIFIDTSRDQSKEGYIMSLNFAIELIIRKLIKLPE